MNLISVAQKVSRLSEKSVTFSAFILIFRQVRVAFVLVFYNVTLARAIAVTRSKDNILFKRTGNVVPVKYLAQFKYAIKYLFHLLNKSGSRVEKCENSTIRVEIDSLRLNLSTMSNVYAAYEILVDRIYEIELQNTDYVVIDIGMNVGVASLHFASRSEVSFVIGYEPFKKTFMEAQSNIALNAALSSKIQIHNLGVASASDTRDVFEPEGGLLSATTIPNLDKVRPGNCLKVQIGLISIADVFRNVSIEHANRPILLKMDCEGEEYAIFERLENTEFLKNVEIAIVEWHKRGPGEIVRVLKLNGFHVMSRDHHQEESGLLYAFRRE